MCRWWVERGSSDGGTGAGETADCGQPPCGRDHDGRREKSAGPGHPGPAVAALAPAWPARSISPHAACHLREAVQPRPEARTPGRNPWPAGTAGHTSALTCRAPAAAGSAQRTCRFGRSRCQHHRPGTPCRRHGRMDDVGGPAVPGPADAPSLRALYQQVSRCVMALAGTCGTMAPGIVSEGLDHWSRDLSS